jgi:glycosyltransferase involved in cell wall biosynthesis
MKRRILHIGNEIRPELGCAASLKRLGFDVTYMHLGNRNEPLCEKTAYTDQGGIKLNFIQINSPTLLQSMIEPQDLIPSEIIEEEFDSVIATPSKTFYLAHYLARKKSIPVVLRIWGVKANRVLDHIIFGKTYTELANIHASLVHNLMQIWLSQALVVMDDATKIFLKKLPLFKKLNIIYPTYAALYEEDSSDLLKIEELIEGRNYILGFVTTSKTGSILRVEQQLLFEILYFIAKKCTEIDVIIAGGTNEEAKKKFGLVALPENLKFAGSNLSDNAIKTLYENASLVVIPIFYRSLSNRLLEALYYGRPVLTNGTAKLVHNKLEHLQHIYISDDYASYPNVIRRLIKNEALLEELVSGAKKAYSSFFSARKCGLSMKYIIESVLSK